MKHRSVIAFVIIAAALFSLPQLSHDIQALKGAAGARLHSELLHAFLNLPAGEPTAAVSAEQPVETMLASCSQSKSGTEGVRGRRVETRVRAEERATERTFEQSAMIGDPANDPVVNGARIGVSQEADKVIAALPEPEFATEVAMIIPPESGIEPRALSNAFASRDGARVQVNEFRAEAEGLRVAYTAAARFDAVKGSEWQKSAEEALRKLNGSLPGAYELRLVRDGAKVKVLKLKCAECPLPAPRAPRAPRQVAVSLSQLTPVAPVETAGE
jgi:hypothetical protein